MAEAVAQTPPAPDYGLDAPIVVRRMFSRGGWALVIGLAVFFINHDEYPEPSARLLGVLGSIGLTFIAVGAFMVWSSRVGKMRLRDKLLDSLQLKGDEKILDVGCGRGLLLIGAAKRLKSGKATGIDIWSQEDLSSNSADATKQNAKIEGVSDRVRIENGDARKLVYPDNNYDVVLSSLAIHNIPDSQEREQAIREMWRVLKPGGRILIYDIFRTGEYAKILQESGAQDVTESPMEFLWCVPSRSLTARK
ncbi:MAG TPA: class I SAM-dependent methyltransferase [Bryobacteraceae bacterium]|nr:class I SAM-dependent methyltransferase [Bryobacteraceae bacterium]